MLLEMCYTFLNICFDTGTRLLSPINFNQNMDEYSHTR